MYQKWANLILTTSQLAWCSSCDLCPPPLNQPGSSGGRTVTWSSMLWLGVIKIKANWTELKLTFRVQFNDWYLNIFLCYIAKLFRKLTCWKHTAKHLLICCVSVNTSVVHERIQLSKLTCGVHIFREFWTDRGTFPRWNVQGSRAPWWVLPAESEGWNRHLCTAESQRGALVR